VSPTETLLYGEILVPEAVYSELVHPRGPEVVRERISGSPCWMSISDEGGGVQLRRGRAVSS
jgi:hypothetical protein